MNSKYINENKIVEKRRPTKEEQMKFIEELEIQMNEHSKQLLAFHDEIKKEFEKLRKK